LQIQKTNNNPHQSLYSIASEETDLGICSGTTTILDGTCVLGSNSDQPTSQSPSNPTHAVDCYDQAYPDKPHSTNPSLLSTIHSSVPSSSYDTYKGLDELDSQHIREQRTLAVPEIAKPFVQAFDTTLMDNLDQCLCYYHAVLMASDWYKNIESIAMCSLNSPAAAAGQINVSDFKKGLQKWIDSHDTKNAIPVVFNCFQTFLNDQLKSSSSSNLFYYDQRELQVTLAGYFLKRFLANIPQALYALLKHVQCIGDDQTSLEDFSSICHKYCISPGFKNSVYFESDQVLDENILELLNYLPEEDFDASMTLSAVIRELISLNKLTKGMGIKCIQTKDLYVLLSDMTHS
jgi:hypothetical protein